MIPTKPQIIALFLQSTQAVSLIQKGTQEVIGVLRALQDTLNLREFKDSKDYILLTDMIGYHDRVWSILIPDTITLKYCSELELQERMTEIGEIINAPTRKLYSVEVLTELANNIEFHYGEWKNIKSVLNNLRSKLVKIK